VFAARWLVAQDNYAELMRVLGQKWLKTRMDTAYDTFKFALEG
jgi:hypothetical protein